MSEILHKRTTNIGQWGNSLGTRIKQLYAEMAGMAEKDTEITQAIIKGEHGLYIGMWIPQDQPQLEDLDEQQLQKLMENQESELQ